MNPSVTSSLTLDHRRLDESLAALKRCAAAGDAAGALARLAELRRGFDRHIRIEEEWLFPGFVRAGEPTAAAPVAVMCAEHRLMEELLTSLAGLLAGNDADARMRTLADLTAHLLAHDGKEERILYPMIERAASGSAELQALAPRIEAELAADRDPQSGSPAASG